MAGRAFIWDTVREQAYCLSEGGSWRERSARGVAATLGVSRRTVEGWRRRPAWRERKRVDGEARHARWQAAWRAEMERTVASAGAAEAAELERLPIRRGSSRRA